MKTFRQMILERSIQSQIKSYQQLIKATKNDIKKSKDDDDRYNLEHELDVYETELESLLDLDGY